MKTNAAPDKPVLIFDGVCNLCNGAVDFILRHDRKKRFLFASHQSAAAGELLRSLGVDGALNKTVYLVHHGVVYARSTAALMIARLLPLPFFLASCFLIIPRFIRDGVYDWVVKNRYRWFGTRKTCRVFGLEKGMEGREYTHLNFKTQENGLRKMNDINDRMMDVRKFGCFSMAYSSLQDAMQAFRHPSFEGFVPYQSVWGRAYVLSNPVTDPGDYEKATTLFLKQYPYCVICQATPEYVEILKRLRFYVTGFGVENILRLKDFEVSHRVRPNIKRFLTRLKNLGYSVIESRGDAQSLSQISTAWLERKQNKREYRFLARPFVSNEEPHVRYFLLARNNEVLGFVSFDPIFSRWHNGLIESYVLQHLRLSPSVPKGAADFLLTNALFIFKNEPVVEISLGLSLLHQRSMPLARASFIIEFLLKAFYQTSHLYPCRHVGEHKDRYHAQKRHTYLAFSKRRDVWGNAGIAKVNGLI